MASGSLRMNLMTRKLISLATWIATCAVWFVFWGHDWVFYGGLAFATLVESALATERADRWSNLVIAALAVWFALLPEYVGWQAFLVAGVVWMVINCRRVNWSYQQGWTGTRFRLKRSARRANARASERS